MNRLTLRSPAKLNLSLKVINKRPDGYHNLKTLFERIDLCDKVYLTADRTGEISFDCDHPALRRPKENLAFRAAALLKDRKAYSHLSMIDLINNFIKRIFDDTLRAGSL